MVLKNKRKPDEWERVNIMTIFKKVRRGVRTIEE